VRAVVAEQFLRALGAKTFDKSTMPWLTANCPLAQWRHEKGTDHRPSFGVYTGQYRARCHCLSCNFSGPPEALVAEIGMRAKGVYPQGMQIRAALQILDSEEESIDLTLVPDESRQENQIVPFPEGFWQSFPVAVGKPAPMNYLVYERLVRLEEVHDYDFRWDAKRRRVCLPVRDRAHRLCGVHGRLVDKTSADDPPYWRYKIGEMCNPQVWLGEQFLDLDQPVLLVESMFDWLMARRVYKNTVAPLSASVSQGQCRRLIDGFMFVHLFDPDKAGRRASARVEHFLPSAKHVPLWLPDGMDPDEFVRLRGEKALVEIIGGVLPLAG
jgi:hypothetical protein